MQEIYRILDANFNRAREALRVAEDCGRFVLNDPAITTMAKHMRSDLREMLEGMPFEYMVSTRDVAGDVGTEITAPTESKRESIQDVAVAACRRLTEALRSLEEYSKMIAPGQTLQIERLRYDSYTLEQRLLSRFHAVGRLEQARLYVLISSHVCSGSVRDLTRQAIAGGADIIQLREKQIPDGQMLALAAELKEMADQTGRMLIINDRPDLAALVEADGVHVGQEDLPVGEARRLLRPGSIVGKSTHSLAQARAAVNEGADYIAIGPIFPTKTKEAGPAGGLEMLRQVAAEITVPVVAIGGINADNLAEVVEAGARRVAICSAVCCADEPQQAAQQIKSQLDQHLQKHPEE